MSTTAPSRPASLRTAVPVLIRDVLGPYLVYFVLRHAAGWSTLMALVGAAVLAAALVVLSLIRSRRVDPLAAVVLLTTLAGIVVALWTGDARATLARESLVSAALGVAFLVSLLRRPLMFSMLWALRGDGVDPADGWAGTPEDTRHALRVATAAWGVGLLADAVLRVVIVLTLDPDTAAGAVTALTLVTIALLLGWMRWYLPSRVRPGQVPAGPPAS
jgi:hypothetical protein